MVFYHTPLPLPHGYVGGVGKVGGGVEVAFSWSSVECFPDNSSHLSFNCRRR